MYLCHFRRGRNVDRHCQLTHCLCRMAKPTSIPVMLEPTTVTAAKWHAILTEFFRSVGLFETLRGFEADLLVLSRAQHELLPRALQSLAEEVRLVYKEWWIMVDGEV
jgi:hypothetical protein